MAQRLNVEAILVSLAEEVTKKNKSLISINVKQLKQEHS